MVNIYENFELLAGRAQLEPATPVDVTASVMAVLSQRVCQRARASERQFMYIAAVSAAAAAVLVIVATLGFTHADAANEVSQAISWVVK
jgi:hypothetical protein